MRSSVLLAATAALLWACKGDPTGDLRSGADHVIATPSVLFVTQGSSKNVVVEVVDGQGGQLASSFTVSDVGAAITVAADTGYNPVFVGNTLRLEDQVTRARFVVTAVGLAKTSFKVTASGKEIIIPVTTVPANLAATFSNATPGPAEDITITPPAGLTFAANATVSSSAGAALVKSVAAGGASLVANIIPGTTGPLTVTGVIPSYAPSINLTLRTAGSITVGGTAFGTDDPATAPTLTLAALNGAIEFYDVPVAGAVDNLYKLVLTAQTTIQADLDWDPHDTDVDILWCNAACTAFVGNFNGATGNAPETSTVTLAAGTYHFWVNIYAGSPPAWYVIKLTTLPNP